MTLGGRAAEQIVFGELTTGASNDLEKVTAMARQMVTRFGMSETLGPRVFGHDHGQPFLGRQHATAPDYSLAIAREIDDEIRRIVDAAHDRAEEILLEHRDALTTIARILLDRETLSSEQFESLLAGENESDAFEPVAGRTRGRPGSVTQIPILSMPDDDVTHPIPDVTGYITEGQIVLSRELDRRGIAPPIDVLASLSRLMNAGIGERSTRSDHRGVADQLSAFLGRGRELRRLSSIVGEQALSDDDRRILAFVEEFERRFIGQGEQRRTIEETLDLAWTLLARFPAGELKRISPELVERHHEAVPNS